MLWMFQFTVTNMNIALAGWFLLKYERIWSGDVKKTGKKTRVLDFGVQDANILQ